MSTDTHKDKLAEEMTTIQISKRNHAILSTLGTKAETFDDIITKLLKQEIAWKGPRT